MEASDVVIFQGGPIFDGQTLLNGRAARFDNGLFTGIIDPVNCQAGATVIDLQEDILSPGYVDLQVNGGDGVMLNDAPSVDTLRRMAMAHKRLGCRFILPTLITDTPTKTRKTIAATLDAIHAGVPGLAGLHLEGPHLSVARKGAHDAALIRPLSNADLHMLLEAAQQLPVLMVTLAPENATLAQVTTLAKAGVVVSLGHTDAPFDTCMAYFAAGARCVTHLFNAMSQLGNREPGLVGAALASGTVSSGIIADGIHVHPQSLRAAWKANESPGKIFLVSDAMAVAGTEQTEFDLEGRKITRRNGRLTLADGTLAGADLDLTTDVRTLVECTGLSPEDALRAAISIPAALIGHASKAMLNKATKLNDMIRLSADLKRLVVQIPHVSH